MLFIDGSQRDTSTVDSGTALQLYVTVGPHDLQTLTAPMLDRMTGRACILLAGRVCASFSWSISVTKSSQRSVHTDTLCAGLEEWARYAHGGPYPCHPGLYV